MYSMHVTRGGHVRTLKPDDPHDYHIHVLCISKFFPVSVQVNGFVHVKTHTVIVVVSCHQLSFEFEYYTCASPFPTHIINHWQELEIK